MGGLSLREKTEVEKILGPYHKPTQVDKSSRLRHSSNDGSRNSAIQLSVSFTRCSPAKNSLHASEVFRRVQRKNFIQLFT